MKIGEIETKETEGCNATRKEWQVKELVGVGDSATNDYTRRFHAGAKSGIT